MDNVNIDSGISTIMEASSTDEMYAVKKDKSLSEPSFGNRELDKIVVRLSGGRRAWIVLPVELYAADKDRIKAQIDVIVADDEV